MTPEIKGQDPEGWNQQLPQSRLDTPTGAPGPELTNSEMYGTVFKADEHTRGGSRTGGPVRNV